MDNLLKIKEIRIAKNYTLDELSKKSGISKRMISAYEANENDITLKKLQKIAMALEVGIGDLIRKDSTAKQQYKYSLETDMVAEVDVSKNYGKDDVPALKLKIAQLEAKLEMLSAVNEKLIEKLGK